MNPTILLAARPSLRKPASAALWAAGIKRLVIVDNGSEAKRFLDVADTLIADVGLPEITGFKLAEVIRDRKLRIPVIFLSMRDCWDCRVEASGLTPAAFVTLATIRSELVKAVRGVMESIEDGIYS